MAYFLKKSKLKKGLYLQIYESFYDPVRKETAHKSYQALGYAEDLIKKGIADPVAHYSKVVKELNEEARRLKEESKIKQIGATPERYLGYFLLRSIYQGLKVKGYLELMQSVRDFHFSLSELLEALIYSRVVDPCSKNRTLQEVVPKLYEDYAFSYDQVLDGIEYLGQEYEKITEIFSHQVQAYYPFATATTYFDCTNFYFEIDREDGFRKKGPSKENRKEPLVGLGLLLDQNQIPLAMKLYPGNLSEKPLLKEIISELKARNQIKGRTVRVADKGLNSAANITEALKEGDGYLFSKSVKQLPEKEKVWVLLDHDYREVRDAEGRLLYRVKECVDEFDYRYTDEKGKKHSIELQEKRVVIFNPKLAEKKRYEIKKLVEKARILKASQAKRAEFGEAGKYVSFGWADKEGQSVEGRAKVSINYEAVKKDLRLAGYNLLVTSEIKMSAKEIYSTYHNLWRIEESFKVMKSYLDARPVYLQKEASICGHFLICYLSVLLLRLLQFKVLENKYSTEKLIGFMRSLRLVKLEEDRYINITASSGLIKELAQATGLPLTNYFLNEAQIKKVLNHRF